MRCGAWASLRECNQSSPVLSNRKPWFETQNGAPDKRAIANRSIKTLPGRYQP